MKSTFDSLIRSNPMRIEISRFRRRFLGFGGSSANNAVLALILLCYTGIVMLVVNLRGDLPPMAIIMFQTGLFCFFGPAMLHGAIAGERERRSWDLLLVAPITKAQIVAGKFMGALAALGIGAVAMAIPTVLAAVGYGKTNVYNLVLSELVSLAFCMLVCAWTIFLSARVKRPFMALGASIATLAIALVVFPGFIASLSPDRITQELTFYLHPFSVIGRFMELENVDLIDTDRFFIPSQMYGLPQIAVYLGLSAFFLIYAERTLHFAENEIKFMPQGHHDA